MNILIYIDKIKMKSKRYIYIYAYIYSIYYILFDILFIMNAYI